MVFRWSGFFIHSRWLLLLIVLFVPGGERSLGAATPRAVSAAEQLQISAGAYHTCVALPDGGARCWGRNSAGQLGNGTMEDSYTPVVVGGSLPLSDIVAISAGESHTCAVLADTTARCWGANNNGELGNGTISGSSTTPIVVGGDTPLSNVVAISVGDYHTCAVLADATARCWGSNTLGQLGDGTTTASTLPVVVGGGSPLSGVVAIGAGGAHSCAALADGSARCWGWNDNGQLGDGSTTSSPTPVVVGGATPLSEVVAISAVLEGACALLADTTVRCWGWSVGDGTGSDSATPVVVGGATPLSNVVAIDSGAAHSCALLADGSARCWGYNTDGQLGNGTTTGGNLPVVVGGATPLAGVAAISAGGFHTCAVLLNTTVRCWGNNIHGQLGNRYVMGSSLPISVLLQQRFLPSVFK